MDWWNDIWIMLSQNWTTWFGTWKWETFWSTAGVAANVYLAYVAVKTLRTSQIQAISSEKQTKEILDSAERDRQKDRNLLRPAIFVSLRPFGDTKFHIMIINCPVYPIVFTDMEINSSNYFEEAMKGIDYLRTDKTVASPLKPTESLYLFGGSFAQWDQMLQSKASPKRPSFFILPQSDGSKVFANGRGDQLNPESLGLLSGPLHMRLPFAYMSPEGTSHTLYIDLHTDWRDESITMTGHGIIRNTEKIFSMVEDA